ncbi:MAG: aldo/keto reductase [Oscillospiraceae bacterium]|nr:aldo/keto reductase [Oscillospiraceae bacterium]
MSANNPIPNIKLNNGVELPILGFGMAFVSTVFSDDELPRVIGEALEEGYRFFDCAPAYGNQAKVAKILKNSGVPREELFITTKIPAAGHGYENTLNAYETVTEEMGLDYLDLYMIHHPLLDYESFCASWKALEKLNKEGRVRSIGMASFLEVHLEHIFRMCEIPPQVDLLECNPFLTIESCRAYCASKGVHVVSWFAQGGPLVPLKPYPLKEYPLLMENECVVSIAKAHGRTPAQIPLRWALQKGMTPLVRSSKREHMRENREIFDFVLSDVEMSRLDALNYDRRFGLDPMKHTANHP